MKVRNILILALAAVLAAGCSKKESKKANRMGRTARGNTSGNTQYTPNYGQGGNTGSGGQTSPYSGKLYGEIVRGTQSQSQFQQAVNSLVAAQDSGVGYVSGDSNQSTGIRFWGNAEATTGAISISGNQNYSISATRSRLRIEIYDDLASQYGELPIDIGDGLEGFVTAGGYIQGNYAQLAFQDTIGWIVLDGYFNSSYFSGNVWYGPGNNQMSYLGQFNVPACGFFRCY